MATRTARSQPRGRFPWAKLSDRELLKVRVCDLGLSIEKTWLAPRIENLREELAERDLRLRPHFWLSDEWFCPGGIPGVGLPFYLAHPRLMRLERAMMLEVEGGNKRWCDRLLRHEVGHAIQHGFNLHRKRRWQRVFGLSSQPYPDHYTPKPGSRNHVLHLYLWYAQSHPDEDFAETFAVWLTPGLRWRRRYAGWPALAKLEYVDELMTELAGRAAPNRSRRRVDPVERNHQTLAEFYEERQAHYGRSYPGIYDRDLLRLFSSEAQHQRRPRASVFLRRHKNVLRRRINRWTGENQFTLEQVFRDMIGRCQELKLHLRLGQDETLSEFTVLLTVRTLQYFYGRPQKHPL